MPGRSNDNAVTAKNRFTEAVNGVTYARARAALFLCYCRLLTTSSLTGSPTSPLLMVAAASVAAACTVRWTQNLSDPVVNVARWDSVGNWEATTRRHFVRTERGKDAPVQAPQIGAADTLAQPSLDRVVHITPARWTGVIG